MPNAFYLEDMEWSMQRAYQMCTHTGSTTGYGATRSSKASPADDAELNGNDLSKALL